MKMHKALVLCALLWGWIALAAEVDPVPLDQNGTQKQETVLDRIAHVEREVHLEIPIVARWCDRLELKKSRINVGDCELHIEEEGEGVPIVLLHGGPGGTHHSFHPEFSRAKEFSRIIYYDQRGCGLSDYKKGEGYTIAQAVADLESLRKALGIEKWIVLGWSYGGFLAQCYALEHSESMLGLVLVASGTGIPPAKMGETRQYDYILPEEKQRMTEVSIAVAKAAKERGWSQEKTMELVGYNRHLNGDWKRQHYYMPTPEQFGMAALYEWKHDTGFNAVMSQDQRRFDLKGAFENCPIPTLIFEAKWDLTWTPEKIEAMRQNHPGARLVVLEQAGHVLFRDEPEKFFGELKSFVKTLSPISWEKVASWKEHLAKWEKEQEDPLLSGPMNDAEAKSIAEFREMRQRIKTGEKYENSATPLQTFLSLLSALHHRDGETLRRIQIGGGSYSTQDLESWENELDHLDILRAPLPPERPEPAEAWPVFLKDPATNDLADTHVFGFWEGKWLRIGNMGGPTDWRSIREQIKKILLEWAKKRKNGT
jgi:proline iminopeptidase